MTPGRTSVVWLLPLAVHPLGAVKPGGSVQGSPEAAPRPVGPQDAHRWAVAHDGSLKAVPEPAGHGRAAAIRREQRQGKDILLPSGGLSQGSDMVTEYQPYGQRYGQHYPPAHPQQHWPRRVPQQTQYHGYGQPGVQHAGPQAPPPRNMDEAVHSVQRVDRIVQEAEHGAGLPQTVHTVSTTKAPSYEEEEDYFLWICVLLALLLAGGAVALGVNLMKKTRELEAQLGAKAQPPGVPGRGAPQQSGEAKGRETRPPK
uniref:Uncharacterized protein n=1 Tax=Alexandrium monilatum TaxID=311494 RepID=A0A7S4W3I4_9DINO